MGIQRDAGELLAFIYKQKIDGKEIPKTQDIEQETVWDKGRILQALQYLIGKNMIEGRVLKSMESTKPRSILINDVSPTGIDVVENQKEFKKHFNCTVNLGLLSFSWGAFEK